MKETKTNSKDVVKATKRNEDAMRWARALVARQKKYKKFSAMALNMTAARAEEIAPVVKDGVKLFKSTFDRGYIDLVKLKIDKQYAELPDVIVRDYEKERSELNLTSKPRYRRVKFGQIDELRNYTGGVTLPNPLLAVPEILDLVLHEKIVNLCLAFYGAVPKLSFLKVRHAFAFETYDPKDTQLWHYDPGSFKLLKVMIYLNDVKDETAGPFQFIRRTHFGGIDSPFYAKSRYSEEDLSSLGASSVFNGIADAGDAILCDATGIHRGLQPSRFDRTVLIANYCLHREYGFKSHKLKVGKERFHRCSEIQKAMLDDIVRV